MTALSPVLWAMYVALAQAPAEVPVQTPKSLAPSAEGPSAEGPSAEVPVQTPTSLAPWQPVAETPAEPSAEAAPVSPPPPEDVAAPPLPATPSEPAPAEAAPQPEESGPPFYTERDVAALRARYNLEPNPPTSERKSRWRCLIADPTCGVVVEVQATSGYAYRVRQGDVSVSGDIYRWHSARVQYDVWVSIPTLVEHRGSFKYTRVSLGPKGGIIASDSKDVWGNVGFAGRYWLSRARWAPTIEFSSGLAFRVAGVDSLTGRFDNVRSPIGFVADVGFGLGGFGAIVLGGQFDSPLAREDVPEVARTPAAGMFYIGFRGNILWGAPAALGVATHAAALRAVHGP